jgi:biopolymer transport protein ExbD
MAIKVPGKRYGKRLQKMRMFGGGAHHDRSGLADLLVTPLVDMFVIIVLFLIANFSATGEVLMMRKDVSLPEASNVKEVEMVPVVLVSATDISVSGQVVATIDDVNREEYLNIPPLEEKLREMKKQYEDLRAGSDAAAQGMDVNIQGDKAIPFKVLKKVMYSCATAGYGNINFAVMSQGSEGAENGASASAAE